MLHQLRRAVDPRLALARVMAEWDEICEDLAEPPRKRRRRTLASPKTGAKPS